MQHPFRPSVDRRDIFRPQISCVSWAQKGGGAAGSGMQHKEGDEVHVEAEPPPPSTIDGNNPAPSLLRIRRVSQCLPRSLPALLTSARRRRRGCAISTPYAVTAATPAPP